MIISDCLLESITSFLKRMQESHEKLVAGEGVRLVAGDAVERSNLRCIAQPYGIVALFHRKSPLLKHGQRYGFCCQVNFIMIGSFDVD